MWNGDISNLRYLVFVYMHVRPVQNEDGFWRIRMNYELNDLIKNADIVRFVKSKRMAWLGHVMRVEGKWIPKRVLEWKPTGRRNRGRPRKRWIVDIEEDIQIMGIRGWKSCVRKGQNGRKSLERLKSTVGCNASKRWRRWRRRRRKRSCQEGNKCVYQQARVPLIRIRHVQGGSNMTGTDLYVNKPHCAAAVRPWESEATTSTLPPARVRTSSVLSGSC